MTDDRDFRVTLIDARRSLEDEVRKRAFAKAPLTLGENITPRVVFYFCDRDRWFNDLGVKIARWDEEARFRGHTGRQRAKSLWMPVFVEDVLKFEVKIYDAHTIRASVISPSNGKNRPTKIRKHSGRAYKLRVVTPYGVRFLPLTEWVVVGCNAAQRIPEIEVTDNRTSRRLTKDDSESEADDFVL